MEFYYHADDRGVLVLSADGGLNEDTAGQFLDELGRVVDAGVRRVIVDCGRLRYISSAGLGVLIRLHKRMADRGGDVKLAAVDSGVVRLLELTRLSGIFHIHETVEQARRAFDASPPGP